MHFVHFSSMWVFAGCSRTVQCQGHRAHPRTDGEHSGCDSSQLDKVLPDTGTRTWSEAKGREGLGGVRPFPTSCPDGAHSFPRLPSFWKDSPIQRTSHLRRVACVPSACQWRQFHQTGTASHRAELRRSKGEGKPLQGGPGARSDERMISSGPRRQRHSLDQRMERRRPSARVGTQRPS